ncbi:MAG: type II toxin-antitoxin system VapC family toxin [Protaetiibacter sp.]
MILLDTHLLIWTAADSPRLSRVARELIESERDDPCFSAASIWEVGVKTALRRSDFEVDPRELRRYLLAAGYQEFDMTSEHGIEAAALPPIHHDPLDRMLVAQARVEGATLLTSDTRLAAYGPPVQLV